MYATTDIDEAAYLIAEGFSLRRTQPPSSGDDLVTFIFPESDDLSDAVAAWEDRYVQPVHSDVGRFSDARQDLFRRVREVRG